MAKIVIAGSSSCPYYAKLELLADELAVNLPHFQVHKELKPETLWRSWLEDVCKKNDWKHEKSPIVWRELVDRGGKGLLIGGFNDFMEYAQCYYGVTSNIMTDLMLKIKAENEEAAKEKLEEEIKYKSLSKPIHICITNASSSTAYSLIGSIASGEVFGKDIEISLRLLDSEENMDKVYGAELEAWDLASPLLRETKLTKDPTIAFKDATAIFILDEVPLNNEDETRSLWLERNAEIFKKYAEIIDTEALKDVKVVVSGNGPVNFNTHVLIENTPNISKQNIVAASRLQERRMRGILAKRLKINAANVKNAIIWGDCSYDRADRTYADVLLAKCHGYDGAIWGPKWFSRSVIEMVHNNTWLTTDFISDLRSHHNKMNEALRHETSISSATALSSLMRDWFQGKGGNEIYSLGVESEGWYGVKGCVFSLPVKFDTAGSYQVVWDMEINEETKKLIADLENELKKDIKEVYPDQVQLQEEKVFGETANEGTDTSFTRPESPAKAVTGEKLEIIEEEAEVTNEGEKEDEKEEEKKEEEENREESQEPEEKVEEVIHVLEDDDAQEYDEADPQDVEDEKADE